MTRDAADGLWLDALLRAARPTELEDDGFSAGVLARIVAPSPMLAPEAALAALRRAENGERRHVHWTVGGGLVGAAVAVAAAWLAGTPGATEAPGLAANTVALLVASCSLAWLAIAVKRDAAPW